MTISIAVHAQVFAAVGAMLLGWFGNGYLAVFTMKTRVAKKSPQQHAGGFDESGMRHTLATIVVLLSAPALAANSNINHRAPAAAARVAKGQGQAAPSQQSQIAPGTVPPSPPPASAVPPTSQVETGARELVAFVVLQVVLVRDKKFNLSPRERSALTKWLVREATTPSSKRALAAWAEVGPAYGREIDRAQLPHQRCLHARRAALALASLGVDSTSSSTCDASAVPPRPPWSDVARWRSLVANLPPIEVVDLIAQPGFPALLRDEAIAELVSSKLHQDLDLDTAVTEAVAASVTELRALVVVETTSSRRIRVRMRSNKGTGR